MNLFSGYTEEWQGYRAGEQTTGYPARTQGQEAAHPWLKQPRTKEATSEEKERIDFSAWTNGDSLPQSKEIQATGNLQGI